MAPSLSLYVKVAGPPSPSRSRRGCGERMTRELREGAEATKQGQTSR